MLLLLPLILLLLLSNAIALTVTDLPMVVQDLDGSPQSRHLIDAFRASISFRLVAWPAYKSPEEALTSNAAKAVLIIPAHFGRER